MGTGVKATFVISWSQTETDGLRAAPQESLTAGASWRWDGEAIRVDGVAGPLLLDGAEEMVDIRRRAARMVQRLIGVAVEGEPRAMGLAALHEDLPEQSFVLSDGRSTHVATLVPLGEGGSARGCLVMFLGEMPPAGRDLWIVRSRLQSEASQDAAATGGGVICFASGTRIRTEGGIRPIESLRPGDMVQTRDNGLRPVLWCGSRRMSGARLHVMPHLRPIRIRADVFGAGRPEEDLLVSPRHRLLVRGAIARDLFNAAEVLVAAEDLVDGTRVLRDGAMREVTYHHLLLESHELLFANGVETESFHPAEAALDMLENGDRARLLGLLPGIAADPMSYGAFARRSLTGSEAAILCHRRAA